MPQKNNKIKLNTTEQTKYKLNTTELIIKNK